MKTMILAAFAALSLTAAIAPMANAASFGRPNTTYHQGTYNNTGNNPNSQFVGGGD
jgi:hypothetical protein